MALILTSRGEEYGSAARDSGALAKAGVIELGDLAWEEGADCLAEKDPRWEAVLRPHAGEEADPARPTRAIIAEALKTPLMVGLAQDNYPGGGRDPAELLKRPFRTAEEFESHLLDNFVPERYSRRPANKSRWAPERAQRALRYLAVHRDGLSSRDLAWWEIGTSPHLVQRMITVGLACALAFCPLDVLLLLTQVHGALPFTADLRPARSEWRSGLRTDW